MPDWAWIVAFVVVYMILTQWLLPKLGVPTCWVAAQNQPRREGRDLPKTVAATSKFVAGGFSEHLSDLNH